ncbi:unnamed protein product [Cylindrotheca closterium]|uniref:PX domain-containing protein n=1 Tax=Cylindrotheca closterium TaxID=2856 RepID=A0AAD2PUL4_9STRA|nr:unnamed protein product [Cylindrotheca closterium]
MLKRGSKKQERTLLNSSPLLSESFERVPESAKQSKKSWKLFGSSSKPKNGSGKNARQTSYDYDYGDDDYYYKDDEDAMKAWEPAPSFLPFPSQVEDDEENSPEQQPRMRITDNETTTRTLADHAKQQQRQQQQPEEEVEDLFQHRQPQQLLTPQSESQTPTAVVKQQTSAPPSRPPPSPTKRQPQSVPRQQATKPRSPKKTSPNRNTNLPLPVAPTYLQTTKAVLARPFGRESLLVKDCRWIVQVSAAEWADDTWMYRVTVQERQGDTVQLQDYGFCLRSLSDFGWLEQALSIEYQGALLLPSLSISLGIPHDIVSSPQPPEVESRALAGWLSDVLNGIRGQGELILSTEKINLIDSESLEAFLYRQELVGFDEYAHMEHTPRSQQNSSHVLSPDGRLEMTPLSNEGDSNDQLQNNPFWDLLFCGASNSYDPSDDLPPSPSRAKMFRKSNVSSKALGDSRTFQLQNSFVESSPTFDLSSSPLARHLSLLQAERDLVWAWRARALGSMELLGKLKEQEKNVGAAWKRFAITVSNLFTYEKEMEFVKLGDAKRTKLQSPYRKLHSSTVDECLRVLTNTKMDRSIAGLDVLEAMLNAYIGDLSSVHPSFESYLESLHNVSMISHEMMEQRLANKQVVEEKKSQEPNDASVQKFLTNERLFAESLTTLCCTAPLRTSRMAHKYIEKEHEKAQSVAKTADGMVSKISVFPKETLAKVITRHGREEQEDRTTEMTLVQRIVGIGNNKKFVPPDQNTQEVEKGVELSKEDQNEAAQRAAKRDNALRMCRERMGRWDSKVAMAIMEAVGVGDANVRVEETTRELRLVRKFAIGLREHMQRCVEALETLKSSMEATNGKEVKQHFVTELQNVLSTMFMPSDINAAPKIPFDLLRKHGIALDDPLGWLQASGRTCGGEIANYMNTRESGTDWLINTLGELLKDYNERVESIESFVYMECVGIQLEKHFSQHRATALAAFEKKTDITSAINIATRKRLPQLVKDLQVKLETVGADVSHTTVKEAKEAHLESKTLKQELSVLSMRRLTRSKEISTERVIALMTIWSKEEESSSREAKIALKNFAQSLEYRIGEDDLKQYLEASPSPAR